jgi:hypothetical protein
MTAGNELKRSHIAAAAAAGLLIVLSAAMVVRHTSPFYADTLSGAGIGLAVWILFSVLIAVPGARKKAVDTRLAESAALCASTAALAGLVPVLANWAAGAAAEPLLLSFVCAAPPGLVCGMTALKCWVAWSRRGKSGAVYLAGAAGALLAGPVFLLIGAYVPLPETAQAVSGSGGFAPAAGLIEMLSRPENTQWLMPFAGIAAAVTAIAFGGGKGSSRPVGLAIFTGGSMQGALALGYFSICLAYGFQAYWMAAVIFSAQLAGLAFGAWVTGRIKVPALWVMIPLHGAICLVSGAGPAVSVILAREGSAIAAVFFFAAGGAMAGLIGGMHFGLAARVMTGGLVPDEKAAGLFALSAAGALCALLAAVVVLFPAFGAVQSLKATALASAGATASLLMALNRR